MEVNGLKPWCPKSGMLLDVLVKSLRLHLPEVGGRQAAEILISRSARRYFSGNDVKEVTCRDLCRAAVEAADYAGLLAGFHLPGCNSGLQPCPNEFLADVLFDWLARWDSIYRTDASLSKRPRQDAGFAIARQAALDLGPRAGALIHLCGVKLGDFAVIVPGDAPLASLLNYIQDPDRARWPVEGRDYEWVDPKTGKPKRPEWETEDPPRYVPKKLLSPKDLDVDLERDETTIAKWMRDLHDPSPASVKQIVKYFAQSDEAAASLLRWFRVQLALIDIGRRLTDKLGQLYSRQLLAAFCELAFLPQEMYPGGPVPQEEFLLLQVEALERGPTSVLGRAALLLFELSLPLMQLPPAPLPPDLWLADVQAARRG